MSASPSKSSEQYSSAQAIPNAVTVVAPAHHLESTTESWSSFFNNHSNPSSFGRNPPPKRRCQDYDGNCSLVFSFMPYFNVSVTCFSGIHSMWAASHTAVACDVSLVCNRCKDDLCAEEITSLTEAVCLCCDNCWIRTYGVFSQFSMCETNTSTTGSPGADCSVCVCVFKINHSTSDYFFHSFYDECMQVCMLLWKIVLIWIVLWNLTLQYNNISVDACFL